MYSGKGVVVGKKRFGKEVCSREVGKKRLYREKRLYSCKVVVFGQKLLYSVMWLYLGKSCCIWVKAVVFRKVVVFGQKWFYSDKRGCIREKVVVFGQIDCIRYKVVLFGQKRLY